MEFKQIKGFPEYYVCDDGYVYKDMGKNRGLKQLKGSTVTRGYKSVVLHNNGREERFLVHRLVAMYFIPNPENKPYVDHVDTVPGNNAVSNLRWVTPKENSNNVLTSEHMFNAQRSSNETPLIFSKKGITIRFDNQFIAEQFFKTSRDNIMLKARTNKTVFGFKVTYDKR